MHRGIGRAAGWMAAGLLAVGSAASAGAAEITVDELNKALKAIEHQGSPLFAESPAWRCDVASRALCEAGRCSQTPLGDWPSIELEDRGRVYVRCDVEGCERNDSQVFRSGLFTVVELPGHSSFIRIRNDGSRFVEVSTAGEAVFISHGSCAPR